MESYLSDANRLAFEHNHNNKPIAEIARENGVHPGVVYRLFKRLGMKVNKRSRPPTEDHIAPLLARLAAGYQSGGEFATQDLILVQDYLKSLAKTNTVDAEVVRMGIVSLTSFLPPKAGTLQRLWHLLHKAEHHPCSVCGKPTKWDHPNKKYRDVCSRKCLHASDQAAVMRSKREETSMDRYGAVHYSKSDEGRKRLVEFWTNKSDKEVADIVDRRRETLTQRYGVDSPSRMDGWRAKVTATNKSKYGTDWYTQTHQSKLAIAQMWQPGGSVYYKKNDIVHRRSETMMARYGVSNISSLPDIKQRKKTTLIKNYGVHNYNYVKVPYSAVEALQNPNWVIDQHYNQQKPLIQIAEELGVGDTMVGRYLHGHGLKTKLFQTSWGHKQLSDALTQLGIEHTINDRTVIKPKELDIYIEQHKVAIEYCGLYWHSEQRGKTRLYHHTKWKACQDVGVRLLTIFEDEWIERPTQVLNKIAHMCGKLNQEVAYARKCDIVDVNATDRATFLETHHIQGDGRGSITHGLAHNGQLVAVATWIERSDGVFELNRYATACRVPGGLSKLVSHFKKVHQWTQLISFADLRYSNGDMYATSGWRLDKVLAPDYSYSPDGVTRHHKFNYRRDRLAKMLEDFDPALSEWENCFNHAILRLWDCGKLKFTQDNI